MERQPPLHDTSNATYSELREKIQSKMDVGKFFAGFITLFVGIIAQSSDKLSASSQIGIIALIASLAFCVMAVISYDSLLMPQEYGNHKDAPREEYQDWLKDEMVRCWSWLFVPGVFCFGVGMILALAKPVPESSDVGTVAYTACLVFACLVPVLISAAMGARAFRSGERKAAPPRSQPREV